jgi:hypothetical protein
VEDAVTSLEELYQWEREAVEPSSTDLDKVRRRLGLGVGMALGATATTVGTQSFFSKIVGAWGMKAVVAGTLVSAAGVGVGVVIGQSEPTSKSQPQPAALVVQAPPHEVGPVVASPPQTKHDELSDLTKDPSVEEAAAAQVPRIAREASKQVQSQAERSDSSSRPADLLADHTRLLSEVTAALNRGSPSTALSLMNDQTLKGSPLSSEFLAARIVALCELGRLSEARPLIQRLQRHSPESPAMNRVVSVCKAD